MVKVNVIFNKFIINYQKRIFINKINFWNRALTLKVRTVNIYNTLNEFYIYLIIKNKFLLIKLTFLKIRKFLYIVLLS